MAVRAPRGPLWQGPARRDRQGTVGLVSARSGLARCGSQGLVSDVVARQGPVWQARYRMAGPVPALHVPAGSGTAGTVRRVSAGRSRLGGAWLGRQGPVGLVMAGLVLDRFGAAVKAQLT